ncbi:hypothetical protein PR048_011320 [Dryococelus australis]|uniref:Uncharacterized protein n=1 Tax=Dryococelus australis TaxID=614101 RepID=A0ABQ9HL93_9NEOP|nr:hypothetical protein PR048_011320 [Dryococelus australis]
MNPVTFILSCFEGDCLNYRPNNRPNRARKEQGREAMQKVRRIPGDVVKAMNTGFFLSKKDQCETCITYKLDTVSAEDYQIHQKRENESREEKEREKKTLRESNKMPVFAVDFQKVLTCPYIKTSTAYYKTKLKVHNWSVFNLCTSDRTCYIYHEGNGYLDSNGFSSMPAKFLSKEVENNP